MKEVCVITGGGSGMGLATAKVMAEKHAIVISGRTEQKLQKALDELRSVNIEASAVVCDVSDRVSVENLAKVAGDLGHVTAVIHAAGISPNMGDPESVLRINALGTIHVHEVFYEVMSEGGCLIDVSSMGAYVAPSIILPARSYRLSGNDPELFLKKMLSRTRILPKKFRSGLAYAISKNFMIWYAAHEAPKFAEKKLRVLSVSPGAFETDMGDLEKDGADNLVKFCAIKRYGKVEEIAHLLAFCADKRLGYLTGVDILCDGGCIAGYRNTPFLGRG
ncbi:MAG: SDR family oxidoreductase [Pseudomonadales bacterium]|nr:SDR family oxidoreductase [Pseudomonadales bacterium]